MFKLKKNKITLTLSGKEATSHCAFVRFPVINFALKTICCSDLHENFPREKNFEDGVSPSPDSSLLVLKPENVSTIILQPGENHGCTYARISLCKLYTRDM